MDLAKSITDAKLRVIKNDGTLIEFHPDQLRAALSEFTNNPDVIKRSEVLILTQLLSYSEIKQFDLKCIVYRTLRQLRYSKVANQYYRKKLAHEL
ncbi:hypothetical protein MOO44_02995 [Nicoliella spurrieriana]|uniref:ATP-cone domain-containing protein n=1 Tax=Nicoliella spurrieriana TaxID=2925830 RepID=A0A976RSU8_9LACO|nr:hypothetical protein [Nicoliella spurrieriana]UQS87145.1 hypothetical protein MOO44_02995 [Nicoliella spurrieriana]